MRDKILHKKTEKKYLALFILLFLGTLPAFLFLYMGLFSLNIYVKANKYKVGTFYMENLDCGDGHGGDTFNCYGYGTINNEKASVDLGLSPDVSSIYENPNYADLSSDTIAVFYRPDLKQTIVKKENEEKLDKNKYLYKGIKNLIYPIVIYPLLIFFYRKTSKKLKQLESK